jgi:hypothetical protein
MHFRAKAKQQIPLSPNLGTRVVSVRSWGMPSSSAPLRGMFKAAYCVLILAIPLLVASTGPSRADQLSWIRFGSPCYGYDPYDRYHRFGRYYPYPRCYCARRLHYVGLSVHKHQPRARWLKKKHKGYVHLARRTRCY